MKLHYYYHMNIYIEPRRRSGIDTRWRGISDSAERIKNIEKLDNTDRTQGNIRGGKLYIISANREEHEHRNSIRLLILADFRLLAHTHHTHSLTAQSSIADHVYESSRIRALARRTHKLFCTFGL